MNRGWFLNLRVLATTIQYWTYAFVYRVSTSFASLAYGVSKELFDGSCCSSGVCEKVDCVKGKCVETGEFLGLGFKCECDPGWTQMQLGPLAFPACTLPNSCSLIWCGDGKCEISGMGHYCKCNEGSSQYMNMSKLPCLDECVYGADCKGVALEPKPSLPLPPFLGHDGVCKFVDCAKGKCVATGEFLGLGFECICDPGWKQIQLGPITYPACNVPNCTLHLGCGSQSALPPPSSLAPFNILDPCSLVWCNNGKCEVNGTKHYCQCNEGSENLMDVPELPCFDQCVFGADCKGVQLLVPSPPPPPPPRDGSSGVPKDPNCSRSLRAFSVLLLFTIFPVLM
ncbi:hypothetical protein MTR67_015622 [Solanum verrucosum]|uniref:EGF-like domain-containing protein n=1 Tax=Solanum verrucosum TaxID=315347 RepID=A0AAF0TIX3_SOLVR|nr:hypothetical protein MTR67_015622 [Solanum verrucosum]